MKYLLTFAILICSCFFTSKAQIGKRFPSERKVVKDPVTGIPLTFLTSTPLGDSKIYQTHNQWTSDGQWLIFRSGHAEREAMAVNEKTGEMVQVTEGGYIGMLNVARNSMKLFFMRESVRDTMQRSTPGDTTKRRLPASLQIIEVAIAIMGHRNIPGTDKQVAAGTAVISANPGQEAA